MGSIAYDASSNQYAHPLISERAVDEPRPLKVVYIGAGISGICAAIQFPRFVPNIELAIYEKNADVGGTWFENRSGYSASLEPLPCANLVSTDTPVVHAVCDYQNKHREMSQPY